MVFIALVVNLTLKEGGEGEREKSDFRFDEAAAAAAALRTYVARTPRTISPSLKRIYNQKMAGQKFPANLFVLQTHNRD